MYVYMYLYVCVYMYIYVNYLHIDFLLLTIITIQFIYKLFFKYYNNELLLPGDVPGAYYPLFLPH